jgi:hypothetical protein
MDTCFVRGQWEPVLTVISGNLSLLTVISGNLSLLTVISGNLSLLTDNSEQTSFTFAFAFGEQLQYMSTVPDYCICILKVTNCIVL